MRLNKVLLTFRCCLFIFFTFASYSLKLTFPKLPWSFPKLTREDKRNFKLLFLIGLITIETSSEIYVRLPQEFIYNSTPTKLQVPLERATDIAIIFPGAGGPDEYTERLKTSIMVSDENNRIGRVVEVYDWLRWRGNFLRAAFDSQAVGKKVCTELALDEEKSGHTIKHLQAIGISVGAFAADSCIKAYSKLTHSSSPAQTRLTLLDPFTSKGVFGYGWGIQNFGKTADIVEHYLNRNDPVPTTNDPLTLAYTIDITNSPEKRAYFSNEDGTHSWPVLYLALHWETKTNERGELLFPSIDKVPKGVVFNVE